MEEGQLLAGDLTDQNLRTACIAKALLDGQSAPEPSLPEMPTALPVAAVDVPLDAVRAQHGLN